VQVVPRRVLLIEDIVATKFKCCKIWLACDVVAGDVIATEGARAESIIECGWFPRAALERETVYPWIIRGREWNSFRDPQFVVEVSPSRRATF
jgi:hypothetical protein